jgi:uncharacterized protein YbaR (Trm112 family)
MDDQVLSILRCPATQSEVRPASDDLVAQINELIRAGQLRNLSGQRVTHEIDGGLIRAAGDLLYPIVDQIPVMLHDEAIPLDQLP